MLRPLSNPFIMTQPATGRSSRRALRRVVRGALRPPHPRRAKRRAMRDATHLTPGAESLQTPLSRTHECRKGVRAIRVLRHLECEALLGGCHQMLAASAGRTALIGAGEKCGREVRARSRRLERDAGEREGPQGRERKRPTRKGPAWQDDLSRRTGYSVTTTSRSL